MAGINETFKEGGIVTKNDMRSVFWRSFPLQASFNYERMQNVGFCYSLLPVLKRLYPEKKEASEALKRHLSFFNTTPQLVTFITGACIAMEEENKKSGDQFDIESIAALKAALMGPIAGIGDSFFWGTFRIIAAGIGCGLAAQGSILGAILFLLIFNIPHFLSRYFGIHLGYQWGSSFFDKVMASGLINKVTEVCYILGLTMIGAVSAGYVAVSTPLAYGSGDAAVTVQGILDSLFLNMLPLGVIMMCLWLMKKKNIPAHWLIFLLMIIGIIGGALGILC